MTDNWLENMKSFNILHWQIYLKAKCKCAAGGVCVEEVA